MGLVERLASEIVISAWSSIPDPLTVEILAAQPYAAVTLDMQHGGHDEASVLRSLPMITGRGKLALVRIPVGRFDMASRALDFGAEAVIAPMINSVDEARSFVAAMKYPPVGERSWGPTFATRRDVRDRNAQDWLTQSNKQTLAIAMIETRRALDALDEILAVDGIDAILVGPSDFSIAWSQGATVDAALEEMMPAIADIAQRTTAAGKIAAIFVVDPALCGRYQKMGYRLMACGADTTIIQAGAAQTLEAVNAALKG